MMSTTKNVPAYLAPGTSVRRTTTVHRSPPRAGPSNLQWLTGALSGYGLHAVRDETPSPPASVASSPLGEMQRPESTARDFNRLSQRRWSIEEESFLKTLVANNIGTRGLVNWKAVCSEWQKLLSERKVKLRTRGALMTHWRYVKNATAESNQRATDVAATEVVPTIQSNAEELAESEKSDAEADEIAEELEEEVRNATSKESGITS